MKGNTHAGVCPICGAPYGPDDLRCSSCGTDLMRQCPACGALNPSVARKCMACGQELEILDSLFARITGSRADWLREAREESEAIKSQEEAASQSRLADMWAVEERRREALAQSRAERDRQQRILVTVAVSIFALIVLGLLVALVVMIGRTLSPYGLLL